MQQRGLMQLNQDLMSGKCSAFVNFPEDLQPAEDLYRLYKINFPEDQT